MNRVIWILFLLHTIVFSMTTTKSILVLHSYSQAYSWTNNVQRGINSVFDITKYEIHIEYMDTKRYHSVDNFQNLIPLYKDKYKNKKFDVILVTDNNAFSFLKFYREEIFQNAPMVFCGVNSLKNSDIYGYSNLTGVSEEPDVLENFQLIKKLHPKNKNVYIVVDVTSTGNIALQEVEKTLGTMPKDGVNYHILRGYSLDEVKAFLKDKTGVVFLTVFFKDNRGNAYEHYELVKKLDSSISLPIYGLWDINFGNGLVGGYLTSGYYQGKEAAKIAKRVLGGEDINSIEILYKSPNRYMFDYKQMKKHNIKIKDLPKNHFLINYKKTFYEEYKIHIYLTLLVMTILSVIILSLLVNIQKRKRAEHKLKENEKNLETTVEVRTKELKYSIETLEKAQEQLVYSEKMSALGGLVAGVSHEINTPIGLGLTGITHFLDITKIINKNYKKENLSEEEFEKYLEDSETLAEVIYSNLRKSAELVKSFKQISVDQTSEEKRNFNLKIYTKEILVSLTNITKKRKILFDLECEDVYVDSYPGAYSQIMTNLFMNAIKHAFKKNDGGKVNVSVKKIDNKILIQFKDNGQGIHKDDLEKIFNPFFTTNREFGGSGLGLNIVYNIVKTTFAGTVTCKSTLGEGTVFDIELSI